MEHLLSLIPPVKCLNTLRYVIRSAVYTFCLAFKLHIFLHVICYARPYGLDWKYFRLVCVSLFLRFSGVICVVIFYSCVDGVGVLLVAGVQEFTFHYTHNG
jgi:hypothetical protein